MKRKMPYSQAEKSVLEYASPAARLDIGRHSAHLLAELEALIRADIAPISQIILCATLVDSLRYEVTSFGEQTDDGFDEGYAWLNRAEREALGWLRARRNALVHVDSADELSLALSCSGDDSQLKADASRALKALLPLLEEREIIR